MHLFLYGTSGVGKSTAIKRAMDALSITPAGFSTKKLSAGEGERVVLYPAGDPESAVTVAVLKRGGMERRPAAFDKAGVAALKSVRVGETVLMDELGFLENDAFAFQRAVLETLAFPCRVVGVIKQKSTPFLVAVREAGQVKLLAVTPQNRAEAQAAVEAFLKVPSLAEALLVEKGVTAIVGGGGKTTLMLRLARELSKKGSVVVCTTTHIRAPQNMSLLLGASEAAAARALKEYHVVCLAERETETGKLIRPQLPMETLASLADYVLVEADGSRGLPLKAHAAHEPQIPHCAKRVIYVVGADGIGKPVSEAAHRPELYARLIKKSQEAIVTPEDAALAVGTIKNAVAVINKVETAQELAYARAFAKVYEGRAAVCSLKSEQPLIELWENKSPLW